MTFNPNNALSLTFRQISLIVLPDCHDGYYVSSWVNSDFREEILEITKKLAGSFENKIRKSRIK